MIHACSCGHFWKPKQQCNARAHPGQLENTTGCGQAKYGLGMLRISFFSCWLFFLRKWSSSTMDFNFCSTEIHVNVEESCPWYMQLVEHWTRDPKAQGLNPVRSTRTICESFSESKCCAGLRKHQKRLGLVDRPPCECGSGEQTSEHFPQTCPHPSGCPTPVCIHTHTNDRVRMLKIL